MLRAIFTAFVLLLGSILTYSQTVAPDFTAVDCDGTSHNLYTELNAGKIVILVWVMPCWGCISGAQNADSTVESMSSLNPNGVLLWFIDDGPPSDCDYVEDWLSDIGLKKQTVFGNYNNEINQDDYGGAGMPHIVVVGTDKNIYYNDYNGSGEDVGEGLQAAINVATNVKEAVKEPIAIYPNPILNTIKIESPVAMQRITITSISGQLLQEVPIDNVQQTIVDLSNFAPGTLVLKITDANGNSVIKQAIKL